MATSRAPADEPLGREVWIVAAVVVVGVIMGTIPFAFLEAGTSYTLLAVVLQGQLSDRLGGGATLEAIPADVRAQAADPLAAAFASTFWWAVGTSMLALVPATILAVTERRERRSQAERDAVRPETIAV